jgi:hypothetical protein
VNDHGQHDPIDPIGMINSTTIAKHLFLDDPFLKMASCSHVSDNQSTALSSAIYNVIALVYPFPSTANAEGSNLQQGLRGIQGILQRTM